MSEDLRWQSRVERFATQAVTHTQAMMIDLHVLGLMEEFTAPVVTHMQAMMMDSCLQVQVERLAMQTGTG